MLLFKKINVLCVLLLSLLAQTAYAQTFGGNPPSVKWMQVNTPAAKVIFPQGMDSTAQQVAAIIDSINGITLPTIGAKQKQVNIVLQNQTTQTNGYVGLAPFRSEFYLTPQQNSFELGATSWPGLLSLHEYRHVQQYNNMNVGLSKILSLLFGQGGQAIGNALSVPDWFFEGDAVYNETLLTRQGRGRLPYFFNDYRALWAANKNYSWMKLRNGSYIDYIPSHYPLGYMLVAYGRQHYGDNFWRDVVHDAAAFKYGFYPLQKAIKLHAGVSYKTFRKDAFAFFKQQFNDAAPKHIPANSHFIADEEYPAWVNDSTFIYLKNTWNQLPVFVKKTGTVEQEIAVRGLVTDNYFSYRDGKITYAGYRPDIRWGYRNYGEIRVVDINTGIDKAITHKTKYFAPAYSSRGDKIVAVQVNTAGIAQLHLLNANDGTLISAVPNPANFFYTYPQFLNDSTVVAAVRDSAGKMGIAMVNTISTTHTYMLPLAYRPIGYLTVQNDTVYYTATAGKNDVLYALTVDNNKLYRLKNDLLTESIGNYQPAVSAGKLAWVGLTAYGYRVHTVHKNNLLWVETTLGNNLSDFNVTSLDKSIGAGMFSSLNTDHGDSLYRISTYNKWHKLFNFHSLVPEISDPNYKFSLIGENILNTFQSELFFNYNRNEGYKQLGFEATYGALFPYLSAGADYIFNRNRFYRGNDLAWNEISLHGGLMVPLNFSRGKKLTGLNIGTDIYFSSTNYDKFSNFNRNFTYLNSYITFSTRIQQARQHIYPRLGQSFTFINKYGLGVNSRQFLAAGTFYFPGLIANHNLILTAAHQRHGRDDAVGFSNNFAFSRGYNAQNLYRMYKLGANYHFPIAYPDAGIANTAYLLRIRGNIFYEYTRANDFSRNGNKFKANFRSVGAGVFFDAKFFNQQPLSFGIRYSYLLDDDIFSGGGGHNRIELVLPVSIF